MNYPTLSRFFVTGASLLIAFGLYHQAFKTWKTRSVRDFAGSKVAALLVNELAWLNYGLMLGEWPIIFVTSLNLIPAIAVVVAYCRFKDNK